MLDRLFLADRGSLLTELMTGVIREFGIDCSRLHNDSTSVSVHGAYQAARGREVAGVPTPSITLGHSKDHRPDLKQLVYILTVAGDHAVPVIYRLADGNTSDDPTHIPTWDQLVKLAGSAEFLYVADCKLASRDAMRHIDRRGGRFITVLPRSRNEDTSFRAWMQDHQPDWAEAHREPGARLGDPDQCGPPVTRPLPPPSGTVSCGCTTAASRFVTLPPVPAASKRRSPRSRTSWPPGWPRPAPAAHRAAVHAAASDAIACADSTRSLRYTVHEKTEESYRHAVPGRPGPVTAYRRTEKNAFQLTCDVDAAQVAYDAVSDGCWPLITAPLAGYQELCRDLSASGLGTFGELDSVGARSVLRRYSDAWFATARRRKDGDETARYPRRRRGLVPVRWYAGTFGLDGRVLRIPVAKGCPPLAVRLDRDLPYPAGQVRSVTLGFDAGRLYADVTAEVPVAQYPGGEAPDAARVAGVDLGIIHPYAVAGPDGEGLLVSGRAVRAECRQHLVAPGQGRRSLYGHYRAG